MIAVSVGYGDGTYFGAVMINGQDPEERWLWRCYHEHDGSGMPCAQAAIEVYESTGEWPPIDYCNFNPDIRGDWERHDPGCPARGKT